METLTADQSIENYVRQAAGAGCLRDQVERFVQAGFFAFPKMLPFHAAARAADNQSNSNELSLGGTRYNGKTHHIMAQIGIDDCQRVGGIKYLFLRKLKVAASEALDDLVRSVFRYIQHEYKEGQVTFPNGSRIVIGGFNNERDIDRYLGINYDGVVIEEATQLSEQKIDRIMGSVRTSIPGWRARKYYSTNPDGIGLQWFKRRFVQPWREGKEIDTRFWNCHWRDNPLANSDYIAYLNKLKGPLAAAWRDGDWDAFAGQAFPEWNYDEHVIDPWEIPLSWFCWRSLDYGYIHPMDCLYYAKDPYTGRIYVTQEINRQMLSDRAQARLILDSSPDGYKYNRTYASPDMWARKADEENGSTTSPADNYKNEGLVLTKADNDRINGARKIHSVLANLADGKPGLQIFSTCTELIECLPRMTYNPSRPEDVLKVDAEPETGQGGDDPYDDLRYGLTRIDIPDPNKELMQRRKEARPITSYRIL